MTNGPSLLKKVLFIIPASFKKEAGVLGVLLLLGAILETLGLGLVMPLLTLITQADLVVDNPRVAPWIAYLGNPDTLTLVYGALGLLVSTYVVKGVFLMFLAWRQAKFSYNLSENISSELFRQYLLQPYTFHLQRNSSELIRNVTGEVSMLTGATTNLLALMTEGSTLFGIGIILLWLEPIGALSVIVFLGSTAMLFQRSLRSRLAVWGQKRQYHDGFRSQHLLQGLGGVKDILLGGRVRHFAAQYSVHNRASFEVGIRYQTLQQAPRLFLEVVAVMGLAILVVVMVGRGSDLNALLPTLGVFVAAAFRMIPSLNRMVASAQVIRYSAPVVDLLYDEFKQLTKASEAETTGLISDGMHSIVVDSVGFSYDDTVEKALNGITLRIEAGSTVGIVGPSGSGKSTLVDVILGLLAPQDGEVRCDDIPVRTDMGGWQRQVGYVPQTIYLTDDSMRRNIAFGLADDEIDEERIQKAVESAQLKELFASLPSGLDTEVGERGVRLSGGQRQRIGIARALYHDPAVLVLDEATSALDEATEAEVMKAIDRLHGSKTILVIAHRLSTVRNCDWLFRLETGRLVAQGPFETVVGTVGNS